MRWFRDCANSAPGAASPRRETISSSMTTTLLPCDRGRWKTGKTLSTRMRAPLPERIVYLWNLDEQMRHGDQSGRSASSYAGARIRCSRSKLAPRFGNAERSACRQRSATDGGGASTEHWIDARHFERIFQPLLARHRSSPGTVPGRCGIDLERASRAKTGNAKSPCEVKLAMFDDSTAAACPPGNGSIRSCRCVWNAANAVVSTRSALLRSNCRCAARVRC